jgi:hypothetical protein
MITLQVENIEKELEWVKTCPFQYAISSIQGGFIHIKIFVDEREKKQEVAEHE